MSAKSKVLVVDDMSTHLLLLQSILQEEGYDAAVVDNPNAVMEMMQKESYDAVLLDIMMPGMDGFEVLKALKKEELFSYTPVIVISAKTDSWSIKKALDLGAFDYLTKPINIQDIRNKVKAALDSKQVE